jgi:hypothetical protein
VTQRTQRGRLSLTVDLIGNCDIIKIVSGPTNLNWKLPSVKAAPLTEGVLV